MIDRRFILAGKACFTLELPTEYAAAKDLKPHYTFRVDGVDSTGFGTQKKVYFVKMLTGSDNTSDYTYVGMLNAENGDVRLTTKSKLTRDSVLYKLICRLFSVIVSDTASVIEDHGFSLHHEGKCCRCGRLLTTPLSIERGIGPECYHIMNCNESQPVLF